MANTRELRRRIKSIKNTSQITRAMQMVAATKMRRAQNQALSGRPYIEALDFSLAKLLPRVHPELHPFLQASEQSKVGVLLLTTDKSLCGALNTSLFRFAQSFFSEHKGNVVFNSVGKKGRNFIVKTDKNLKADFDNPEVVTFRQAKQITKLLAQDFLSEEIGRVYLIYPHFVSTLRQEPTLLPLLPIRDLAVPKMGEWIENGLEFLLEPNADDLLEFALLHFIESGIYQALLETKASEHSARMIAMKNATDNAKELVEDLQLVYNQTRQAIITNEILEIASASAALE